MHDLEWDKNGRLTGGLSTSTFEYNWDGKLRSATSGGVSVSFRYDPMGNRVYKQASGSEWQYAVDLASDVPGVLFEYRISGGEFLNRYIYADNQIVASGDPRCLPYFFYITDRLGSVRQLISASPDPCRYYTYDPFGKVLETGGTVFVDSPLRFTGQWYESEIGQYYMHARMYDPYLGRFTSRDPVFGEYKNPMTLHPYLYCLNDPMNKIDPDGRLGGGLAMPVLVGYAIHGTAISYAVYGVDSGNDKFLYLAESMEKTVAPVMALVMLAQIGPVQKIIDTIKDQTKSNYMWGMPKGPLGKWVAIATGLSLIALEINSCQIEKEEWEKYAESQRRENREQEIGPAPAPPP